MREQTPASISAALSLKGWASGCTRPAGSLSTTSGAMAGGLVGGTIGRHLDDAARAEAECATARALDTAPAGGGAPGRRGDHR